MARINESNFLGFYLDREFIEYVTTLANRALLFITPVSIAFFYFIYKEQISWANKRQSANVFVIYITCLISFFIVNMRLSLSIVSHESTFTLEIVLIVWLCILTLFFTLFLINISYSIKPLNVDLLINRKRKEFILNLNTLLFFRDKGQE